MGVPTKHWNFTLVTIVQRKIHAYTSRCFHLELKYNKPSLLDLTTFLTLLEQHASALEFAG